MRGPGPAGGSWVANFDVGDRVIFKYRGERHRGKVTQVMPRWRSIVTDTGRKMKVPVGRLRYAQDRVLVLEARLDNDIRSPRSYARMIVRWLSAYGVAVYHERVHTRDDLGYFLKRAARQDATRFIEIIAHGAEPEEDLGYRLKLTFESVDLREDAGLFAGLNGKVILFSCCNLGSDRIAMERIKEASGATAVIAYRVPVEDYYANLHDALIYDRLLTTHQTPRVAAEKVAEALYGLGLKPTGRVVRKSALVVF